MRIKSAIQQIPLRLILICILCGCYTCLQSQVVWEYHGKEVYNFLSRMAQKGTIRFDDNIRPLSRKYIADCLDSLSRKPLAVTEKKELSFYSQEYGNEMDSSQSPGEGTAFFKADNYKRWRSFSARTKNALLQVDPVFTASTLHGSGRSVNLSSSGLNFWGYIGKNWGFQFFYNDISESGTGIDSTKQDTPETGFIRKDTAAHKTLNYSHLRGSISYSWKNGSLSFGQDYLLWGYGENGRIVLSDKAPAFPFVRLDYQLFPWLKFNYTHTWLNSNLIDSNRIYPRGNSIYGNTRDQYIPKFMATHSLQIRATKGLDISVGESIVYSDRLDVGYLFPLMFFKVYDNIVSNGNIRTGSNGQLFVQISSRNNIPKTHLYATLFVDEIRIATLFNKSKSRNQLGITIGGSVTDIGLPYLTVGVEYTRMNPFVYRNLIPAQDYTSYDYSLGDWMGNNFDRIIYSLKYTPLPRLKCLFRFQSSRKGGPGTLAQQYFQSPQPGFLFDLRYKREEFYLQAAYELVNNLSLKAFYSTLTEDNRITAKKNTTQAISLGFTYGL